ncbi:MAG: glutaredoxin domain-containing protein [Firmicutes bacterium]|nr:glutaredoxin domain-containing protein [Bacillota bacterium]
MKKVTVFVITGCPYCAQARKALKELVSENPEYAKVEFEEINEMEHPEIANEYDYMACPSMFIGKDKIYEAHVGEKYDECKAHVKQVLEAAMA